MTLLTRGERPGLTFWEQLLRVAAAVIAVLSLGFTALYLLGWFDNDTEYPFVVNSLAKETLLVALCLLVLWDVRRWASIAVPLLVIAHAVMAAVLLIGILDSQPTGVKATVADKLGAGDVLRWRWFVGDVVVVVAFLFLHHKAVRSRHNLQFLPPCGFRALTALAEVLVLRDDPYVTPAEVGVEVDGYLARFRARAKWKIWVAFVALAYAPMLTLRPPFYVMSPAARERWITRRFLDETHDWLVPRFLRDLRSALIRTAQQFCFFGYYSQPSAAAKVGYLPFSERPEFKERQPEIKPNRHVSCMRPGEVHGDYLDAEIVIVGTGAAGSTLAYELARRGHDVLMLERGLHVDPDAFTENEAEQLSNLYADGALTLSADFRFRVAQGMCVGGSTVVNNAVCFDIPGAVLTRWIGELEAGLDSGRLEQAFVDVRRFLHIQEFNRPTRVNPGAKPLVDAIDKVAVGNDCRLQLVEANIDGCVGSGYCNIGCKYGKKLSMLDWTLPKAQQEFPGRVRVLPECRVQKVLVRNGHASGVRAKLDGKGWITVRAGKVVLSAGAIASSLILQRSNLAKGRAGTGLSFNIASPVTFDFPQELHSERGAQISHYLAHPGATDCEGLAFETWFNPVVSQALFMPGWFQEHWDNMRRYKHMTCLGVVVGSESNGAVKNGLLEEVNLTYGPTDDDFVKLKDGVRKACAIGLQAGALRALPPTFRMLEIFDEGDLDLIDTEIGSNADLNVNSAHPQGGNRMSVDAQRGVVDPQFRVYDTDNVYVCDASVFPSSITVNPQLTVMALAAYAADDIGGPLQASSPSMVQVPA